MKRTFDIIFWTLCPGIVLGLLIGSLTLAFHDGKTGGPETKVSSRTGKKVSVQVGSEIRPGKSKRQSEGVVQNKKFEAKRVSRTAEVEQNPLKEKAAVAEEKRPVFFQVIQDERPKAVAETGTDLRIQQIQTQLQQVLAQKNEATTQQAEQMQRLMQQMQQQQLNQMEMRLQSMQSSMNQAVSQPVQSQLQRGTGVGNGTVIPAPAPVAAAALAQPTPQVEEPVPESVREKQIVKPVPEIVRTSPGSDGVERFSLQIRDTEINQVLDMLGEISGVNMIPSRSVTGKVTVNLSQVTLNEALQAILKSTGLVFEQEGALCYICTPEEILARTREERRLVTKIYRPQYISVQDLQILLSPLLTQPFGKIAVTMSPDMMAGGMGMAGAAAGGSAGAAAPVSGGGVGAGGAGGGGIGGIPQGGSNRLAQQDALLVRDFPETIAEFDRIVEEMDIPPKQVVIEAMILSVKLNDSMQLGVNFALLNGKNNQLVVSGNGAALGSTSGFPTGQGGATISPPNPLGDFLADAAGLKYGFIRGDVSAFVSALENLTDTNLIATPQLMVLNKQKAQLIIGDRLSYSTSTFQNNQSIQNVNFVDAGTKLSLRPFIAPDGLVRMEIHPERSSAVINRITGLPDIATTEVTSNVMVRDGTTIVIGGLIEEQVTESQERIPFLGALPVVGAAFRNKNETTDRRELIILITPRVVQEELAIAEADSAKYENERRAQHFQDELAPANRRNLTRVHYEKALRHFELGELDRAQKQIRQAARQNKNDRQVLRLQERIDEAVRQQRRSWFGWAGRGTNVEQIPVTEGEESCETMELPAEQIPLQGN